MEEKISDKPLEEETPQSAPEAAAAPEPVIEDGETVELKENPYTADNKGPEEIVRLFYVHDMPIIPVASKRGIILGVLHKADVISELADIERAEKHKIDKFITRLARKATLDDILKFGDKKEFIVINLFGEVQGKWTRIQLFNAVESFGRSETDNEAEKSREQHVLEWMIYLILEHIPRGLYAVNSTGRTIFYNSLFEEYYTEKFKTDVDSLFIEESLKDPDKNELVSDGTGASIHFFNHDLGIRYERTPLMSKGERSGYLIFVNDNTDTSPGGSRTVVPSQNESIDSMIAHYEREIIVNALRVHQSTGEAAKALKITKKSLISRIEKLGIDLTSR